MFSNIFLARLNHHKKNQLHIKDQKYYFAQEKARTKSKNFHLLKTQINNPEAKQSKWNPANLFMGLTFSTQLHVKWRKMMPSNNHEYEFGIISFKVLFFTNNFQSDSHLWLHQAWFIKTTVKLFLLVGQKIRVCNCRAFGFGMRKGNLIFLFDYLNSDMSARELEMTPISVNMPFYSLHAIQFLALSAFVEKCYASSKIIYPK